MGETNGYQDQGAAVVQQHPTVPVQGAGFLRSDTPPPGMLYVTRDDQLVVSGQAGIAGVTLRLRVRMADVNGRVFGNLLELPLPSDRSLATALLQLTDGFLLGCAVAAEGVAVRRGEVFASVELIRGLVTNQEPYSQLASGYPSASDPLCWPNESPEPSVSGQGRLLVFTQAQPAAGAELAITVPTGARWRPMSLRFTLTTSAVVGNRFVHVVVDDGAGLVFHDVAGPAQAASLTFIYSVGAGIGPAALLDNTVLLPFPHDPTFRQGWRIRTVTTARDGADQFSAAQLGLMEWLEL